MRVALASVPGRRAAYRAAQAVTDLERFLLVFDPPNATEQAARDCSEIAAELCRLDALTRLHRTVEVREATSVAAVRIFYRFGWRLKAERACCASSSRAERDGPTTAR